jgi:hypothetical protein
MIAINEIINKIGQVICDEVSRAPHIAFLKAVGLAFLLIFGFVVLKKAMYFSGVYLSLLAGSIFVLIFLPIICIFSSFWRLLRSIFRFFFRR